MIGALIDLPGVNAATFTRIEDELSSGPYGAIEIGTRTIHSTRERIEHKCVCVRERDRERERERERVNERVRKGEASGRTVENGRG